jgi:hypothetical protein
VISSSQVARITGMSHHAYSISLMLCVNGDSEKASTLL